MALDGRGVISPVVTEELAAGVEYIGLIDQDRPVVVTDLVAEVPEEGPVGLAELLAHPLTVLTVGFGQIQRDHTVVMTGDHLGPGARKQIEGQSPTRHLVVWRHGELELG